MVQTPPAAPNEVVAKLLSIQSDEEEDGFIVQFWVGQELAENPSLNEAFALLSHMDRLQRAVYSMIVRFEDGEYTMEPDEQLAECLVIFDEHETPEELEPPLTRQWKTGQIAEAFVSQLVSANVFGVWRTGETEDEAEEVESSGSE